MDKKPTVTIGIPAYNEEANIKNTLQSILQQDFDGFVLKEVLVVSDGSTDKTRKKVKEVKDKRVRFVGGRKRLGKPARQNQIFEMASGDIVVLLDADIILASKKSLHYLVRPILADDADLVSGSNIVTSAENSFQKALNVGVRFKEKVFSKLRSGDNVYLCSGRIRAFSPDFKKIMRWPDVYNEDPYSYLWCKFNNFDFVYEKRASIYFQNPTNFKDHKRQSERFKGAGYEMSKYFPEDFVEFHLRWPKKLFLESAVYHAVKYPLSFAYYLLIFAFTSLVGGDYKKLTTRWEVSTTSKTIKNSMEETINE